MKRLRAQACGIRVSAITESVMLRGRGKRESFVSFPTHMLRTVCFFFAEIFFLRTFGIIFSDDVEFRSDVQQVVRIPTCRDDARTHCSHLAWAP